VFKKCWHGLAGLVAALLQLRCRLVASPLQPCCSPCGNPLLQPFVAARNAARCSLVAALLPPCCSPFCSFVFALRFVIIIFLLHLHCPHLIFFPLHYTRLRSNSATSVHFRTVYATMQHLIARTLFFSSILVSHKQTKPIFSASKWCSTDEAAETKHPLYLGINEHFSLQLLLLTLST
jgi:hypothetical protein